MRLELTEDEAALHDAIGTGAFLRARAHIEQGEVVDPTWQPESGLAHGRLRHPAPGWVAAMVTTDAEGTIATVDGSCTCDDPECAHPAALVLLLGKGSQKKSSRSGPG